MFFSQFQFVSFLGFLHTFSIEICVLSENYTMLLCLRLCVCPNEDYLDVLIFVSRFFLVNEKMDFVFAQSEGKKG